LKKEFNIKDIWMSYELHPETPPKGIPLSKRFAASDVTNMYENIRKRSNEFGIKFGNLTLLSNSRIALEASEYARDMGKYNLFHEKMFQTYFTESKDIGDINVINDIAQYGGLNKDELMHALKEQRYVDRLDKTRKEARRIQMTGDPTFIMNGHYKVVGAQPTEIFRDLLKKIGNEQ
jgi:predicted DsbA family dithiol-disulfide isomerase